MQDENFIIDEKVFKEVRQRALSQGADIKREIATVYYYGRNGVEKNLKIAFKWLLMAAEEGDIEAISWVGRCYYHGDGVRRNNKKAFYWAKKGAKLGDAQSQDDLGYLYYNDGRASEKDLRRALYWFHKAAKQGNSWAEFNIYEMYKFGDLVKPNRKKAEYWLNRSAAQNNPNALMYVREYEAIKGIEKELYGEESDSGEHIKEARL